MFRWNIAKSAEAMLSRWAIKRLCKFLLKKKLGKFILGDIDLNQLDVQLSAGTIQLSDLALNVDYLNQKFGATAGVNVKEGSIGSLLVTMPWKGDGCRIDVDELELVLSPCGENVSEDGNEACSSGQDESKSDHVDSGKYDHDRVNNTVKSTTFDVHEGVKTVAKMVKWLLTSFHVKVKTLIVAFDPCIEEDKKNGFCRTLVLRIVEVECGTCISDDSYLKREATNDNFLGLSYLTNFVKFQGAVLEFLQLDSVANQTPLPSASGASFSQRISGCCPSSSLTPIITSKTGGFSGKLKLSIPWENGTLDIRKVDADAYVDPVELRWQPSTIKGFICLWDIFENINKKTRNHVLNDTTESVFYSAASNYDSSTLVSCMLASDKSQPECESSISERSSLVEKELASGALLSESHLISDWVGRSQKDGTEEEPDFGASVHQFFECFDGLRNSQSALGNSGMWNWTCSVFSAITTASNLASGSLYIPSEQQPIETNFKATISGISLLFSFIDDDQIHTRCMDTKAKSTVHYIDAEFQDILLLLQVCPRELNFEAKVEHIEVADHLSCEIEMLELNLQGHNGVIQSQFASLQKLQDGVHGALPSFCTFKSKTVMDDSPKNCCGIYSEDVVRVPLVETSGVTHCQVHVSSGSSGDLLMGPKTFSLKLPHFILWVNISFICAVLDLLNEMDCFCQSNGTRTGYAEAVGGNFKCSTQDDERKSASHAASSSTNETVKGEIFVSNARIIICFPFEKYGDSRSYSSCRQFIALDISSPKAPGDKRFKAFKPRPVASFKGRDPLASSRSLHLYLGDVDAYFIISSEENDGTETCSKLKMQFIAHKIASVADGAGTWFPVISMFWQEDPLTGPWITKRAKILASAENNRSRDAFNRKGSEFASVTTIKDMEDFDTRTRQELILSSKIFVHAYLPPISVNISMSTYENLHYLLHQVIDQFSCMASDPVGAMDESALSQGSVLVECDIVVISVTMEALESVKGSFHSELPGSWHSLRLNIQKFELLSVSNIGGIINGSFLWVSHGEGDLSGSVSGVSGQEFVLISCNVSALGRGGGEGSNVLSSRLSGSDIVHLWDPESLHSYTSIDVRSSTVVAIGGRLDWFDAISSLFSSSSRDDQETDDKKLEKDSGKSVPCGSSFVLNFVDVALSYEPYLAIPEGFDTEFCCGHVGETIQDRHVACLVAASSLRLSNITTANSFPLDYKIRVQDLGLLLSVVCGAKQVTDYGLEHLRKAGYVKVAQEAHVEAILRTNCKNGCMWEVECLESHIVINTCHDTTSGLIRLAAQLQRIFAPDMEESAVHLQNRWNIVQQAHETNDNTVFSGGCVPSTSHIQASGVDSQTDPSVGNLMDEIHEDAFQLSGSSDGQADTPDLHLRFSLSDSYMDKPCSAGVADRDKFISGLPFARSMPVIGVDNSATSLSQETIPEFIEEYFLSDLRPLSELTSQPSKEVFKCETETLNSACVTRGNSGWYGSSSLRILENHVCETNKETNLPRSVGHKASSSDIITVGFGKVKGLILLKNMNVMWRMYGGSDWQSLQKILPHTASSCGRDTTTYIELSLSGLDFKYDVFPDGGIWVSKLSLTIQDFCLNDNSVNAAWKLVLGYYQSKKNPRRSSSKAFKLELESIRPDPSIPLEEYRLRVGFLPMLLHLHQSQLDFFISFFGGKSTFGNVSQNANPDLVESGNLSSKTSDLGSHTIIEEALLPFFQKFEISPVLIRVDYSPCHVDLAALRGGKYVELVNLVPWKGVELQLKHVQAVGIYGWNCVCETIIGEWLEDISQNQVHKLLKGLPPIRSLVSVGSGAAKLVTLPIKNYRKDQRLVKGMQRGTIAFLRSISLEAIGLGVHLAAGAHEILLQAEYLLTTIPPSVPWPPRSQVNTNIKSNQPKDAREGILQAYESISEGLSKSASALVQRPMTRYHRGGGVGSALATAFQAAPAAAIAPASATARAVHYALIGVRNSLDPEHKKESMDKYSGTNQPQGFM